MQISISLPSAFWIFLKASLQQFPNSRIQIRRQETEVRLPDENRREYFGRCVTLKSLSPGQHFIQNRAEREHIAAGIYLKSFGLLRRHVRRCSDNHSANRSTQHRR